MTELEQMTVRLIQTLTSQVIGSVTSWIAVIRRQHARNRPMVIWGGEFIENEGHYYRDRTS